jgi:addiction module HigA family antidote
MSLKRCYFYQWANFFPLNCYSESTTPLSSAAAPEIENDKIMQSRQIFIKPIKTANCPMQQPCRFKEQEREEFELFGPSHPGEILRDEILPRLKISRKSLAAELGVSYSTISKLLNGRRRVRPELAVALARISGTSVLYWLVLQAHHDAWKAQALSSERRTRVSKSRTTSTASNLRSRRARTPARQLCEID